MNVPEMSDQAGADLRRIAELGRELKDRIEARMVEIHQLESVIDEARFWLSEGAPARALDVLNAARERKNTNEARP